MDSENSGNLNGLSSVSMNGGWLILNNTSSKEERRKPLIPTLFEKRKEKRRAKGLMTGGERMKE